MLLRPYDGFLFLVLMGRLRRPINTRKISSIMMEALCECLHHNRRFGVTHVGFKKDTRNANRNVFRTQQR